MRSILGKLLKRKTAPPNQFDARYPQATSTTATQDFQRAIEGHFENGWRGYE